MTVRRPRAAVDLVRFEVFAHRLWALGEEGRIALQRVSASPIVVQGGECMSSFYDPDGTMILACSGHLRFAAATSDAIRRIVEWFGRSPGIHEGDQIFFNDPYVAGSHTYDQMVVAPIFHGGQLIAWAASSSHTADVGGMLSGEATEIFHEGIRIAGLKVVERGEFREDVFRSIVDQCRDPIYVGLDLKSRIAANNVCVRGFLALVEKFGPAFVRAASGKLIDDAEALARARLRSLPSGTWRSHHHVATTTASGVELNDIRVALTNRDGALTIDFTGSGPQLRNEFNSTLPSTVAHVSVALTNSLFWDLPWSDGRLRAVRLVVPEGSFLNCRYPAACNRSPWVGQFIVAAVAECLANLLYAGGRLEDVNAGWVGYPYTGGPGFLYGGHATDGLPVPHGLYDIHASGLGATPARDGVDSGGHANIPAGGVSDVELIEMQYPFLYFSRRHLQDGAGPGRHRGGAGMERTFMIRGSADASTNFQLYAELPQGGFGLSGGFGAGSGSVRALFAPSPRTAERLAAGDYPASAREVVAGGWGELSTSSAGRRVALPEGAIVTDFTQSGGGFGDPVLREPAAVLRDVRDGIVSSRAAELVYGVVLSGPGEVDRSATEERRRAIRRERLATGPGGRRRAAEGRAAATRSVLRFHEALEIAAAGRAFVVRCRVCGSVLCDAAENYKDHVALRELSLETYGGRPALGAGGYLGFLREYSCPGCATLLKVDVVKRDQAGEAPLRECEPLLGELAKRRGKGAS